MNPFNTFKIETTKHHIAALNAEIELKQLTLAESSVIDNILYSEGFDKDGKPKLTMEAINKAKLQRVAMALVKPKMSVEELLALPSEASEAINEIADILNPQKQDEEGN